MAHEKELKEVARTYRVAVTALQHLDDTRRKMRAAALAAHEAGASKTAIARVVGVSRQRIDEILARAEHERAAGVTDVTD